MATIIAIIPNTVLKYIQLFICKKWLTLNQTTDTDILQHPGTCFLFPHGGHTGKFSEIYVSIKNQLSSIFMNLKSSR